MLEGAPLLLEENVATVIIIASWPLACVLFNGSGGVRGPVPVICCDGTDEARLSIMADSLGFAAELEKLMSRYKK